MANPTSTVRSTPAGKFLENGYSTKVAFARDPDVSVWEKTVKAPGQDGGDPIDISTMFNSRHRTKAPRGLMMASDVTMVCAYDPNAQPQLEELINQPGSISLHYPDGSRLDFFGYLRQYEFAEHSDGNFPEVTLTIVETDWDPVNDVEVGPVMTQVAGT